MRKNDILREDRNCLAQWKKVRKRVMVRAMVAHAGGGSAGSTSSGRGNQKKGKKDYG